MNICTWNIRRNQNAWQWIFRNNIEIALLQEAIALTEVPPETIFLWEPIGGTRKWGSGIFVSNNPAKNISLKTFNGWVTAAEVKLQNNIDLIVIDIHAQIVEGYSITTLHHIFSDLTHLIDGSNNILLGGDFNAGLLRDTKQKYPTHKIMFERLEAFGLSNCHRLFYDSEQRTFRNKSGQYWQLDHLFISNHLTKNIQSCDVIETNEIKSLSDHNPIVMDIEL